MRRYPERLRDDARRSAADGGGVSSSELVRSSVFTVYPLVFGCVVFRPSVCCPVGALLVS